MSQKFIITAFKKTELSSDELNADMSSSFGGSVRRRRTGNPASRGGEDVIRLCAAIIGISGIVILFSTLYPIISYEWESAQKYPILISSLVEDETASFRFSNKDYTRASNWFEDDSKDDDFTSNNISYYTLTIPRLGIENAAVAIGGEELSESLIHYPGTAVPGKVGNSVIFGHSILPLYYDPENYLAIFSTLPTLDKGDEIYADYDGITYSYIVEDMFEVKPKDIQILEQNSAASYLTLVTCTPPGHPLKPRRLVVRARLVPAVETLSARQ